MPYHILLDPSLSLSPAQFADAWNASPDCAAAAQARLESQPSTQYDPALAQAGLVLLESVTLGVLANAVYDLVKALLIQKGVRKETRIVEMTRPDGTRLLVIAYQEEEG